MVVLSKERQQVVLEVMLPWLDGQPWVPSFLPGMLSEQFESKVID